MSHPAPLMGDDAEGRQMALALALTEYERKERLASQATDYGTGRLTPYQSLYDLAAVASLGDPGIVVRPEVASRWAGAVLALMDGGLSEDDRNALRPVLAKAAGVAA